MDKKNLTEIQQLLMDENSCEGHIGIKNTHLKLKLLYGQDYGVVDITSDSNGTKTEILIPKKIYPNEL